MWVLGHKIGQGGVSPLESKLVAVREMPRSQTKKEIRTFLGMTGYYRRYIQNYVYCNSSLGFDKKVYAWYDCLDWSNSTSLWHTQDCSHILYCHEEPRSQTDIHTANGCFKYWSRSSAEPGTRRMSMYFSWKVLDRERNYSTVEKECLAVVLSIKHFDVYLPGKPFILQIKLITKH